jgi:hypothetical protein
MASTLVAAGVSALSLQEGILTIRGEKEHEQNEDKENYRVTERRYGSFIRAASRHRGRRQG